jgi:ferredoxin-nitrite reductase
MNRLSFLLDDRGETWYREAIESRLGRSLLSAGKDKRRAESKGHTGIYRQAQPLMNYVGINVPVGRLRANQLEQVADVSQKYGNGEIRISPTQNLILPHISDAQLGGLMEEPILKEFLYHPSAPMKGLVSCVGSDYCHLAAIETKSRALEVATALEKTLEDVDSISMNWSGCPAGCGNHLVADIGLLGKRIKINGEVVDGVDIYMGGQAGLEPKFALKILENVPCDQLPEVLKGIVPYHTRDKLHRIRGQKKKTPKPLHDIVARSANT